MIDICEDNVEKITKYAKKKNNEYDLVIKVPYFYNYVRYSVTNNITIWEYGFVIWQYGNIPINNHNTRSYKNNYCKNVS